MTVGALTSSAECLGFLGARSRRSAVPALRLHAHDRNSAESFCEKRGLAAPRCRPRLGVPRSGWLEELRRTPRNFEELRGPGAVAVLGVGTEARFRRPSVGTAVADENRESEGHRRIVAPSRGPAGNARTARQHCQRVRGAVEPSGRSRLRTGRQVTDDARVSGARSGRYGIRVRLPCSASVPRVYNSHLKQRSFRQS